MRSRYFLVGLIALSGFFASSCATDEEAISRVVITMVDSPGDYDEVNIDIQEVRVNMSFSSTDDSWVELDNPTTGVVNILELTGGKSITIADAEVPAGRISQIRVILGPNNTLVMGDEVYDLDVPSGSQSGLKLQVQQTLKGGVTYYLKLDFDAAKSIVKKGNSGKYGLKPVIKVITEATSGAIKGEVLPAAENVAIYALQGEDTLGTTYAIANESSYILEGIPEGTYDLSFDPGEDSQLGKELVKDVDVTIGQVTMIEQVTLK